MTNKERATPSGEWGYLFHLQDIIATTNGDRQSGNLEGYANGLLTWYEEVQPVIKNKATTKTISNFLGEKTKRQVVSNEEYEALQKIRKKVEDQEDVGTFHLSTLRHFHRILNYLTHKCDLRIKDNTSRSDEIPEALR